MQEVTKAQREFTGLTARYGKCLLPPMRLFASRDKRRKALCKVVDSLSKETFPFCLPLIFGVINMDKTVCGEYGNSESQVDGILEWLPRMGEYSDLLLEEVRRHRKSYGLKA